MDFLGFLVSRAVAETEGATPERATQLGIIGGTLGLTPTAIILVLATAKAEFAPGVTPARQHADTDKPDRAKAMKA